MDRIVVFNLRGTVFKTRLSTLRSSPRMSLLNDLNEDSEYFDDANNEYFFDRHASVFPYILEFCSTGKLHIPSNICPAIAREEIKFWGIPESNLSKCCWKKMYESDEDMEVLENVEKNVYCPYTAKERSTACRYTGVHGVSVHFRQSVRQFLENHPATLAQKIWCGFITLIIVASTILFMLGTVDSLRVQVNRDWLFDETDFRRSTSKLSQYLNSSIHPYILWTDATVNIILTVEWCVRLLVCVNIKEFLTHCLNISDALGCISVWIVLLAETYPTMYTMQWLGILLAFLHVSRVFRVFRVVQYSCGLRIMLLSLANSLTELGILVLSFVCCSVIFAVIIYVSEMTSNSLFTNTFVSMWWSVVTMTTVGYGDFVPTTGMGFFIGTVCSLCGILLIALPVAIVSSNFHSFYSFNKYRARFMKRKQTDKESSSANLAKVKYKT